jgi:hypothetical protein
MNPRRSSFLVILVLFALFHGVAPEAAAQGQKATENNAIIRLLDEMVDMKDFQQPMSMKEALGLLMEKFEVKGKALPILVDGASFRRENHTLIYDEQVQFAPYPRQLAMGQLLQLMLSRVAKRDATFLVRNGAVEITTKKEACPEALLKRKVIARFSNTPFDEAMEELSAVTGASIVLDVRLGDKLKAPVSASLKNDVSLGAALRMLSDMVDLKVVFLPGGIYVTHPFNADNMQRELREQEKSMPKKESLRPAAIQK